MAVKLIKILQNTRKAIIILQIQFFTSDSVLKNILFTSQILATLSSVSDFLIVISFGERFPNSSFLFECIILVLLCPLAGDIEANTTTLITATT